MPIKHKQFLHNEALSVKANSSNSEPRATFSNNEKRDEKTFSFDAMEMITAGEVPEIFRPFRYKGLEIMEAEKGMEDNKEETRRKR